VGNQQKGPSVAEDRVEYFKPTSGQIVGSIGIVVALAVIAVSIFDGQHGADPAVILAALFFGILTWAAMLRPRVGVSQDVLVMRNMVSDAKIPLASIEQLALRQVLAVRAGHRRYVSPAVGRSVWSMRRHGDSAPNPLANYPDFVEERIRARMDEARERSGITMMSDEQLALASDVRLDWAWPELVGLVVTGVGFGFALFL
jgi:hypothetical protein